MTAGAIAGDFYRRIYETLRTSPATFYRYGPTARTYADAFAYTQRVRARLGGIRGKTVATYSEKTFESYASIFGILLSGNAWVPLSRGVPVPRLMRMAEMASVAALLVDESAPAELLDGARAAGIEIISFASIHEVPPSDAPLPAFDPEQDAFIYFTSGSTGDPKGVRLTHRNYITVVGKILDVLPLRKNEVFADYHDIAFVISVPIVFPCVLSEGTIAPAQKASDIILPHKHMIAHHVSVLITVPSTMARLRAAKVDVGGALALNVIILCGEPFHLDVLKYCFEHFRPAHLYNFYGSTEVAPWTFFHECAPGDFARFADLGYVPIGKPLPGVKVAIDDETSELSVAGENVSPGYLRGMSPDRFAQRGGDHWYLTGDVVTRFEDVYVCKGRLDSQVKVDGYRVDLMDVEANLRCLEDVHGAVCFVSGMDSDKTIVAVLHSDKNYDLVAVRERLGKRLPKYMLPRKVVCLKDVPLNKSGKIDRRALSEKYA